MSKHQHSMNSLRNFIDNDEHQDDLTPESPPRLFSLAHLRKKEYQQNPPSLNFHKDWTLILLEFVFGLYWNCSLFLCFAQTICTHVLRSWWREIFSIRSKTRSSREPWLFFSRQSHHVFCDPCSSLTAPLRSSPSISERDAWWWGKLVLLSCIMHAADVSNPVGLDRVNFRDFLEDCKPSTGPTVLGCINVDF